MNSIGIMSYWMNILKYTIRALEDPFHPLLGPNIRALTFWGLWKTENKFINLFYVTLSIICALFVSTQYIQLSFIWGNLALMMENLSITTVSTMAVIKIATFRIWNRQWAEIIFAISSLEKDQNKNSRDKDKRVTESYVLHGRVITYFFTTIVMVTITMTMLNPLILYVSKPSLRGDLKNTTAEYPQIFSSWIPFDASQPPKHTINMVFHVIMGYYGAGSMAAWDTFVLSVMVFFSGQLDLLRQECSRIMGSWDEDYITDDEAHQRIIECHRHHVYLLKYSRQFNALLSPVMFIYFIICSVMLCAVALQLTTKTATILELFWTLEFLAGCLVELFLFYWHSNQVLFKSESVELGAYESVWTGRNARLCREMALLARGLRRPIVFHAGPFNKMTMTTFTAILKAAYSYYALLERTTND